MSSPSVTVFIPNGRDRDNDEKEANDFPFVRMYPQRGQRPDPLLTEKSPYGLLRLPLLSSISRRAGFMPPYKEFYENSFSRFHPRDIFVSQRPGLGIGRILDSSGPGLFPGSYETGKMGLLNISLPIAYKCPRTD
jgi:hypothetical protein